MSSEWVIFLLHTRRETLLKRAFEAAFPGRVISRYVPALALERAKCDEVRQADLIQYFHRYVYDPGIWKHRVLTVYGDGEFHHYTYALTRLAAERRGLLEREFDWTYCHFDNHRDDWSVEGQTNPDGTRNFLNCASFVDAIAHDHRAIPFLIGADAYPYKNSRGYQVGKWEIPIFSNYFTKALEKTRDWKGVRLHHGSGTELPSVADLRATPTPAYLSFDLDVLSREDIVTNFPQNDLMSLERLCQIVDRVREHKQVFSADILGFPDDCLHALSALTIVILARKILGRGTTSLMEYHRKLKREQSELVRRRIVSLRDWDRTSPIDEGELLEVLRG